MSKPGTRKDFDQFMDSQAVLYANKIRRDYNLPDPFTTDTHYWRVAVVPAMHVTEVPLDHMASFKLDYITFRIAKWMLSTGQALRVWERLE